MKVRAYTSTHIFTGYVHRLPQQRLLDILNGALRGVLRTDEEFLKVSEAEICSLDGRMVTLQSAYINKANILFVREIEDCQTKQFGSTGEPSGKFSTHKLYPFVSKSPISVRLYMLLYTLTGQMHCAKGQCLSDLVNRGARFLALTNVQITSATGTDESVVSFVAVNKAHILCLEEVEAR